MTISELADQAGVTERTIRYYVEQGVLPPPERGRPAEYTDEHVRRLALIRRLKEQYLPLEEIRAMLQRLSLDQVDELLAQHPPAADQPKRETLEPAADYIAGVLRQARAREQMKKATAPPPFVYSPPPPASSPPGGPPLPDYPAPPGPPLTPYLPGSPAPTGPRPGGPPPAVPALPPDYPSPPSAPSRSVTPIVPPPPQWLPPAPERESNLAGQTGTWQRVSLAPGIELHYVVTDDAWFNTIVERLVAAAVPILDALPEKVVEESE